MKNLMKTLLAVAVVAGGILALGQAPAEAANGAVSASAAAKQRSQPVVQGLPLPINREGVKTFEVAWEAGSSLVVDENGVAPTSGQLVAIEVGTGAGCYAVAFDSAVATGLTGASTGRALMPPIYASDPDTRLREYLYPPQFNKGLVLYVSSSACRAVVRWSRNGGN